MIFSENLPETIGINLRVSILMKRKKLPNSTMKNTSVSMLSRTWIPRATNSKFLSRP
jgi:hypothetical protein